MPAITRYTPGEIVLVAFPHSSGKATVNRPALIVVDSGDLDVLVARITTQPYSTIHDVVISDWKAAGLLAPSVVRLHKLATLEKQLIHRVLGSLQPADRAAVSMTLEKTFGKW